MIHAVPRMLPVLVLGLLLQAFSVPSQAMFEPKTVIFTSSQPDATENLAAREIRRYIYLCTGQLPAIEHKDAPPLRGHGRMNEIRVATKGSYLKQSANGPDDLRAAVTDLKPQCYLLKSTKSVAGTTLHVVGGDDAGLLYAAYRFAELLGARFYLHGDVIPDRRAKLDLSRIYEQGAPLFALRGIQPFHDFPEGPDWWNLDDYKAIISQLPKMRMNFIGLHTYPEGWPNAEPTVWIGPSTEIGEGAKVKASYPSSYMNTRRGNWSYPAKNTGDAKTRTWFANTHADEESPGFSFGSSELFETDAFGPETMSSDMCPEPKTPEACNLLFERVGNMLRDAFDHAHALNVKTCVGTETPLTIPAQVRQRLKANGQSTTATLTKIYEGMFRRAAQTYDIDYFWIWTPERAIDLPATRADLLNAVSAANNVRAPFELAICGWGWLAPNFVPLDQALPKNMPFSCINDRVGMEPVNPAFKRISGRAKWAIPWLEDDGALTTVQLWAGRLRADAADARKYGCDGLMGIHWRTRVLGPNASALAQAAWDQEKWRGVPARPSSPPSQPNPAVRAVGGSVTTFNENLITGTNEPGIYRSVRWGMSAYDLDVPKGAYRVTLKFCEPVYSRQGQRVFSVDIQGKRMIANLDIAAQVGKNKALDCSFDGIGVTSHTLTIDFVPQTEYPCIAGIVVQGRGITQEINCGGPAYRDYVADLAASGSRDLSTADFYDDWARHEFGPEASADLAAYFQKLDGLTPRPSRWTNGPGGLDPDHRRWEEAAPEFAFVDGLERIRPRIRGAGNLERFDYWLNSFRTMRDMARIKCLWGRMNEVMMQVDTEKSPTLKRQMARERALPVRRELVAAVGEAYDHLLATVSTTGEMGTVSNWEQHILPPLLTRPGLALAEALGEPLPADAMPSKSYGGNPHLIVPTVRTALAPGEPLTLKVIFLDKQPPRHAALHWREMGRGRFEALPLAHVARGVYTVQLPATEIRDRDIEYYVEVRAADGKSVFFPATAPRLNQTVVVMAKAEPASER